MSRSEFVEFKYWVADKLNSHGYNTLPMDGRKDFVRRYKDIWEILKQGRVN